MKILILGSGGREHALAWKCAQDPRVETVFVAPGNAGSATETKCRNVVIDILDNTALIQFVQVQGIDLTLVGPEAPLVNGVVGEYDNSVMSGCANISQYLGSVSDRAEGRLTCATNAPAVVKTAANSADPNVRNATFVKGNVTWLALNQVGGGISQQEKSE